MTQKEVDEISAKAIKQTPTELRATLECPSGNEDILESAQHLKKGGLQGKQSDLPGAAATGKPHG